MAYVGGAELGVRESRRAKLLRQYHFACGCEACRLEGTELARSEVRQRRIAEIQSALPTWPEDLPSLVDELLQLLADEGMPGQSAGRPWARGALAHNWVAGQQTPSGQTNKCN